MVHEVNFCFLQQEKVTPACESLETGAKYQSYPRRRFLRQEIPVGASGKLHLFLSTEFFEF